MTSLKIIETYNDECLEYDKVNKMYELTLSIAKTYVGNVYKDDNELKRRIKLNSMIVYNYIYNHGNTNNKKYTRVILNRTEQGRSFILSVLTTQLIADSKSGYNDLGSENLVDLSNGSIIDREKIRQNLVSVNTEELIVNSKADLCGYSVINPYPYYMPELEGVE